MAQTMQKGTSEGREDATLRSLTASLRSTNLAEVKPGGT